jgi:hypothetical protein
MQVEAIQCHGRPKEGQALFIRRTNIAQQWAQEVEKGKVHLTLKTIPKEYRRHAKVFSEEEAKHFPPDCEENMTIKLKEDAPDVINCKIYPLTKDKRELLQKWILDKEALGWIYTGSSPYTAPVYFIGKKDSQEKQIIMDYRHLNQWTICDNNPLPNITTAMEHLHGKMLFSKFDICMGYNNIQIVKEDQYKAVIKTQFGTYIPCVMYFGLTNVPPFFQWTMHRDFHSLLQRYPENIGNYMDNW